MSRLNKVQVNSSGLSRQSTRTYKAVRQKSNTDLDKTLKQLKLEHKASISKILQEEYTLKNVSHSLKSKEGFKGETHMSCAGSKEDCPEEGKMDCTMDNEYALGMGEKPLVSKMASLRPKYAKECHKKRHSFHLPSILEENSRCFVSTTKTTHFENLLPPLFEFNNPSVSRGLTEEESGRFRSKTISIPDETRELREERGHRYVMRKRSNDGRIASKTKRKDLSGLEDNATSQGWGEEMMVGCRYLRRSHSSPNVFDI